METSTGNTLWTVRLIQKNNGANSENVNQITTIEFQPKCRDSECPHCHSVELSRQKVYFFDTNGKCLFYSTENSEQLMDVPHDVRFMSLVGSTIGVDPLKTIDKHFPKLEGLFIDITEFDENSFQYFISNICPKLRYLSLDKPIYISNQKVPINFENLIKMCTNLGEVKLIVCPPNSIYAFNCLKGLSESLFLITNKYTDHIKRPYFRHLNEYNGNHVHNVHDQLLELDQIGSNSESDKRDSSENDNRIMTIEFQPNIEQMSERQKRLWLLCKDSKENWRDGICSEQIYRHPSTEFSRQNVQIYETAEDFLTTESTEQLMDVRCISLIGSTISLRLIQTIDKHCPKLECLFINITEFYENSFQYFIANICPKLKHLSLDNSIYIPNQKVPINYEKLIKMCTNLEELKLILFPSQLIQFERATNALNYECMKYLCKKLVLIFVKYHNYNKKTRFCRLRKHMTDQSIVSTKPTEILDQNNWFDLEIDDELFVVGCVLHGQKYYPEDYFEKSQLDQLLENMVRSEVQLRFLRLESGEHLTKPRCTLESLSKFVFLRGLNISIKNCVVNRIHPGIHCPEGQLSSTEPLYTDIARNLKEIETLTLNFDDYQYYTTTSDLHVLDLLFDAVFAPKLTCLRLINAVLDRNLMKKIQQNFFNIQSLQFVDCLFEEESDLTEDEEISDTVPKIILLMNNLIEFIIDNSESDIDSGQIFLTFEHLLQIVESCAERLKRIQLINVGFTADQENQMKTFLETKRIDLYYE